LILDDDPGKVNRIIGILLKVLAHNVDVFAETLWFSKVSFINICAY